MKKLIFIMAVSLLSFSNCNKSSNKVLNPDEAYCIYEHPNPNQKVFISCEKSADAAQQKCIELRNSGHTSVESVKKSTCSDC